MRDASLHVNKREALAIVGESGSGKTTLALAVLGHFRLGAVLAGGSVEISGISVFTLPDDDLRRLRGRLVSFVPQSPSTWLNPSLRVGLQVAEVLDVHFPNDAQNDPRMRAALQAAQLPNDESFLLRYPHELSGGQQQRVTIAMALACSPEVLILDEPTTGLDVTTQARLLDDIGELRHRHESALLYISHDLSVVRNLADRVAVMYGGLIVEEGPVTDLFRDPCHPYTRRLLEAVPRVQGATDGLRGIPGSSVEPWSRPPGCPFATRCEFRIEKCDVEVPLLEREGARSVRCWRWRELEPPIRLDDRSTERQRAVADGGNVGSLLDEAAEGTSADFEHKLLRVHALCAGYQRRWTRSQTAQSAAPALKEISVEMDVGTCLAVVGESGSGKTTLLRCIAGLHRPYSGEIEFAGTPLRPLVRQRDQDVRRLVQLVPQNPDSSLNPRHLIGAIIGRPLRQFFGLRGRERHQRVSELLERVGLRSGFASRLPRELSGGEKQRVAIARALAAQPSLLLCDEITAALDVAVQANILMLLKELRASLQMGIVFVSHDLAVVRTVAEWVVVLRQGMVVEQGDSESVLVSPLDAYTRDLLAATPTLRDGDYDPYGGGW